MRRRSAKDALLMSVSTEIRVHLLALFAVVVPLVAVILPTVVLAFAAYEVIQSVGSLWLAVMAPPFEVSFEWLALSAVALLLAKFIAGTREAAHANVEAESELDARMRSPRGAAGQALSDAVSEIWKRTPGGDKPPPDVAWYSGFQVAAHARLKDGMLRICVSSALWDRVTKKDATAELILAHEMGHLVHRDWKTFQLLSGSLHGMRAALRFSKRSVVAGTLIVVCLVGAVELFHGGALRATIRLELAMVAVASLCFLTLMLSDLLLRRYVSFIIAMVEIRADLCAAQWTSGIESFAVRLESDAALHRSTATDLGRSLFSADMTHISESERIALIRAPQRLFTPKLRYFVWSIVLALLIPLNPITPLLFGGAVDHAIVAATVAALFAATMAMLVLAGFSLSLSWGRSAVLAASLCVALAATSVNLYEVGYALTHYSVAIANDSGFGRDPVALSGMGEDLRIITHGLAAQATDGLSGWWIFVTIPLTMGAMKLIRPAVRWNRPQDRKPLLAALVGATTFVCAIIAARDSRRSEFYDYVVQVLPQALQDGWSLVEPLRLALPAAGGLIAAIAFGAVFKRAHVNSTRNW
jgi:Zn-dependent protease with chaperone function